MKKLPPQDKGPPTPTNENDTRNPNEKIIIIQNTITIATPSPKKKNAPMRGKYLENPSPKIKMKIENQKLSRKIVPQTTYRRTPKTKNEPKIGNFPTPTLDMAAKISTNSKNATQVGSDKYGREKIY